MANALLAQEMAKEHEVTVLTSQAFDLPRESIVDGVRVVRAPVFFRDRHSVANMPSLLAYVPMGIRAGLRLLQEQQFDVVNSQFVVPSGPVGAFLARHAQIPHIITVIGGDLYDPSKRFSPHRYPPVRLVIRRLLRHADGVIGISHDTLGRMRTFYTPELEGSVVPLAIPRPTAGSASRSEYGFDEEDVLLISIGRLVARKAVTQLVKMMDAFKGEHVHLLVVGSGPMEESLRREVAQHQLQDQVHFMGAVWGEPKFELLRMSDLYVSTSEHEGFGLVFLEAMASGLPVVCYDNGGQTDFLVNGRNGSLVPLNNLTQFTESCRWLTGNREQRKAIGEHNEKFVRDFFIDVMALKYEGLFRKAMELKRQVPAYNVQEWPV
jgi:L-malate glycosyltransferase